MNLEDQVCSLELSKRLKELGVKQDSQFYHVNVKSISGAGAVAVPIEEILMIAHLSQITGMSQNWFSAFTVAELGELLPHKIKDNYLSMHKDDEGYSISYKNTNNQIHYWGNFDKNESNVRAKILINLIEGHKINIEDLK